MKAPPRKPLAAKTPIHLVYSTVDLALCRLTHCRVRRDSSLHENELPQWFELVVGIYS